ncbi:MAG: GH92 family glycosyl hydrolase, partial [Rikenellaceae bacterium]
SEGWDWCSGYHISDTTIIGFAHTHLSGTGIGDKGDLLFMPVVGSPKFNHKRDYLSSFSRANETVEAGYYAVELDRYGIKAELTASERVGYHRYIYPEGEAAPQVVVNLKQAIGWDWPEDVMMTQVDATTVEGYRLSKGWAEDDRVYFTAKFSAAIRSVEVMGDTTFNPHTKTAKVIVPNSYYLISFEPTDTLNIEVAISGVDVEGAKGNLVAEGGRSFAEVREYAREQWNDYLSRAVVTGGTDDQRKTFYTALYHTAFFPSLFTDVDGRYRGADGKIYASTEDRYTIFSLWDTYRALHPLFTLTENDKVATYVNTLLDINDQQGQMPVWHLAGNETNCMVGFASVQIIGDAILKDYTGFDHQRAYQAMKSYADGNQRGLGDIREFGYIRADRENESVAKALEYCISDYAVAEVAKKLGHTEDYELFLERSKGYQRYFDKSDTFMKGVLSDGSFRTPFDPAHSSHRGDDFCEGNSWQYTWLAPHDFEGLISLYPSPKDAEAKLDALFSTPFVAEKGTSPDISGMIGQYAHGNEPSHSTIFAYEAMGKPEKSAALARRIVDSLYHAEPDGLSGNEDCGQMSAWYLLNAMGLYQSNPAGGDFIISSPLFDQATIDLKNGKSFTIKAHGYSPQNTYHKRAELNGKAYTQSSIPHSIIMQGGTLELWAQ